MQFTSAAKISLKAQEGNIRKYRFPFQFAYLFKLIHSWEILCNIGEAAKQQLHAMYVRQGHFFFLQRHTLCGRSTNNKSLFQMLKGMRSTIKYVAEKYLKFLF